jgi:hypothetical protein
MNPYPEDCRCSNTREGPQCEYLPDIAAAVTPDGKAKEPEASFSKADGNEKCRFTVAWTNNVMACKDSMLAYLSIEDAGNVVMNSETGQTLWYSGTSAKSAAGIMRPAKATLPKDPDLFVETFADENFENPTDLLQIGGHKVIHTHEINIYTGQNYKLCNDCLSSVIIPRGVSAKFCNDNTYQDRCVFLQAGKYNMADFDFNDQTTSVLVTRDLNTQFGPQTIDQGHLTAKCRQ